jgi:hypothetical protein
LGIAAFTDKLSTLIKRGEYQLGCSGRAMLLFSIILSVVLLRVIMLNVEVPDYILPNKKEVIEFVRLRIITNGQFNYKWL